MNESKSNAATVGVPPPLAGYAPSVGDRFHREASTYENPLTGESKAVPEHNAVVTMVNHSHVVVVVDGREHTIPTGSFVTLAERTLANGSTLTREA